MLCDNVEGTGDGVFVLVLYMREAKGAYLVCGRVGATDAIGVCVGATFVCV